MKWDLSIDNFKYYIEDEPYENLEKEISQIKEKYRLLNDIEQRINTNEFKFFTKIYSQEIERNNK